MALHPSDDVTDQQTQRGSAKSDVDEAQGSVPERKTSGDQRGDGKLQRDERGRIIDQAFSFQNRLDATRHTEPSHNGGRGNCIRW